MVLICISLVTNDVEHVFTCLFATVLISSLNSASFSRDHRAPREIPATWNLQGLEGS